MTKTPRFTAYALAVILGAALVPSLAMATLLKQETFSYPNGNLVGNGDWTAHSAGGANPIQVNASKIVVLQGAGSSEDVNTLYKAQPNNGVTYAAFNLTVPNAGPLTGSDYFAHFRTAANFNFRARVYVSPPTGGGNYTVGISATASGTSPVVNWPSDLSFGQKYHVVTAYDAATGTATLWVDPANQNSSSVSSTHATAIGEPVDSYAIRQGGSPTTHLVTEHVDDLLVDTIFPTQKPGAVPGTSTAGMMLLASLMMIGAAVVILRRRTAIA